MMHIDLKIIKLNTDNLEELVNISKITYANSFSNENTLENMQHYLDSSFNSKKLKQELANNESEFYFAKRDFETSGYLKFNFGNAQNDLKEINGMELERIYVLKSFQGKKIGKFLLNFTIEIAKKRKLDYVWLGVWDKNVKAIEFYKRNGFKIIGTHPFKMGNDIQTDYIMKRTI
jgi:ribosomal protein S18 acetylase RimI-like enzyme